MFPGIHPKLFAFFPLKEAVMVFYTRLSDEHWLRDKLEYGRIVILEDESLWEVHPSDRAITNRWLRISTINITQTQKEGYPYVLSNTIENQEARATYLGVCAPGKLDVPEVA
jgi:hypothetical protein